MRRLWPGWLLCLATAGLFIYMAFIQGPQISALVDGMRMPDAVVFGYDRQEAQALYSAFKTDLEAAQAEGRQSAADAYLAMHSGSDLAFPPMLAFSLCFLAFSAVMNWPSKAGLPRLGAVGFGLVLSLSFAYLGTDFIENSVADAMFGPQALARDFNVHLVFALQVLTRAKYGSLLLAFLLIAALWLWRRRSARVSTVDAGGQDQS